MQATLSEDGRFALSMLQRVVTQAGFRPNPTLTLGGASPVTAVSATSATIRFISDGTNQVGCDGSVLPNNGNAVQTLTISSGAGKLQCGAVDWIAPVGGSSEMVDFLLDFGVDNAPTTVKDFGVVRMSWPMSPKRAIALLIHMPWPQLRRRLCRLLPSRPVWCLRSDESERSLVKASSYKDCSNNDIANSQNDNRLYRTFRSTILIRNPVK